MFKCAKVRGNCDVYAEYNIVQLQIFMLSITEFSQTLSDNTRLRVLGHGSGLDGWLSGQRFLYSWHPYFRANIHDLLDGYLWVAIFKAKGISYAAASVNVRLAVGITLSIVSMVKNQQILHSMNVPAPARSSVSKNVNAAYSIVK